jgi:hypothetical protein
MIYYNKMTNKYYRGGALKTAKGTIFNPTEETIKAHGYEEYVAPVIEPQPPTEEELAELRRQAYIAECDPLSMAYIGYMLEGDEDKAMSARASYLARKAEIRKRFKE